MQLTPEEIEAARQESLGRLLLNAHRAFIDAFLEKMRAYEPGERINASLVNVMIYITLEGVRIVDIAEATQMTRQSVSQFVSELEEIGYVEKIPDPSDGRATLVRLSQNGLEVMEHSLRVKQAIEDEVREKLGIDGYVSLIRALKTIHKFYGKDLQ